MSTPAAKKPPARGTPSRITSDPASPTVNRSPSRASGAATANSASNSTVARTTSVRRTNGTPISARAAVKKPASTLNSSASTDNTADEDSRAETAALMSDLQERLQRAENMHAEYLKQIEVLKSRLDEALSEQGKLEERVHEEEERVEGLENEKRELIREKRELENIYEAERVAVMKEKEESQAREEELMGIISRLKEKQMDMGRPGIDEEGRLSRHSSYGNRSNQLEAGHFAPHSSLQRSNSRSDSKLVLQKDKMIESLRLELAEAQIKLVEMENAGGGRVQELERILLEARMTNARLMEDNESYQLLLSEKTLNGDFSKGFTSLEERPPPSRQGPPGTSLADELSSFEEADDSEHVRRLETELTKVNDEKKALTLYINRIIERLLQHQGFENILNNNPDSPGKVRGQPDVDKELPPPPPPKDAGEQPQGFLQRATSVLGRKSRPTSLMPAPTSNPNITENPDTAPSIPLQRRTTSGTGGPPGHKRSNSEWSSAATIVNHMYRSPPPEPSPGVVSPRNSFFVPRVPSGTGNRESMSSVSSDAHDSLPSAGAVSPAIGVGVLDTPSPPRSVASSGDRAGNAVMAGKTMRPLRLVQEKSDEDAARKAANRGSWLGGWFKGGQMQQQGQAGSGAENVQP